MKTILFVCTGNTCRSSMAEVLFKDLLKKEGSHLGEIKVISAGTNAMEGEKASFPSKEVIGERGLSLEEHRARPLSKELIEEADLILTMTTNHKHHVLAISPEAKEKVYTLKEYVNNGEKIDVILDQMNEVYKKINERKQQFLQDNQRRLKKLEERREALLKELKDIEWEVGRIEEEFREEIGEYEDELIRLKAKLPEMDILDPFGQPIDVYRRSALEIEESLKKLLKKLSKKIEGN